MDRRSALLIQQCTALQELLSMSPFATTRISINKANCRFMPLPTIKNPIKESVLMAVT